MAKLPPVLSKNAIQLASEGGKESPETFAFEEALPPPPPSTFLVPVQTAVQVRLAPAPPVPEVHVVGIRSHALSPTGP